MYHHFIMRGGNGLAHEIYGPYDSIDETVRNVEILGLKGFRSEDIHVIAKETLATQLKDKVDATVISSLRETDDNPMIQLYNTLRSFDMSEKQAENLQHSIEDDDIIITLDTDKHRMGNEYIHDTDVLEEKLI